VASSSRNDERIASISVVVPVLNSTGSLRELCHRLGEVLPELARESEIILVNDGSTDDSWSVIEQLSRDHASVKGIDLMRNYGQHNALLCGLQAARGDVVVTMDDDLQHPPERLHLLLGRLAEGYDVVYGTPPREQHGLLRNLASRITKQVLERSMGAEVATKVSAWRAIRRPAIAAFGGYRDAFVSIDVLLTWGTSRFAWVPVEHEPRRIGESNYTVGKLVRHALNMLTGYSTVPLRLASFIGFFFTLFGVGVLVYVVGRYFISGGSVPGFPFLASVIAIFSGAQLFALGIIGEYLARVHTRSMDRPVFVVRTRIGSDASAPNP
jgi:glycosyltransferase involved in cell wall biosynthesis